MTTGASLRRRVSALIVTTNPHCLELLLRTLRLLFPAVIVDAAITEGEALHLLTTNNYDIVVCDTFLSGAERTSFLFDVCSANLGRHREIIIVTANSDMTRSSLPSSIGNVSIGCILRKPIVLSNLITNFKHAVARTQIRNLEATLSDPIAILIVEDDPAALAFTKAIVNLALPEVHIDTAENADDAFHLFQQHRHDIIISDHRMPNEGDGIELAKKMCKEKADTIFHFITADDITQAIHDNNGLCVKNIFTKPIDVKQLVRTLREDIDEVTERLLAGKR